MLGHLCTTADQPIMKKINDDSKKKKIKKTNKTELVNLLYRISFFFSFVKWKFQSPR